MIRRLPGDVLREVAFLARTAHWQYGDLMSLTHAERGLWVRLLANDDDDAPGDSWGR
jgi:hypothetical protein